MAMPNFLIIGAAKAGTTALYHYLKQHPQIYMSSEKEPHFFAFEGEKLDFQGTKGNQEWLNRASITNIETYCLQFQGVENEIAIGEASALYLYIPKTPERIQHHIPSAKLITILRNPVDRAYSAFLYLSRDGLEPLTDFARALREEEIRIRNNWVPIYYYQQLGFYYVQLKRYFDIFDRDQIRVYLYESLKANPVGLLQDIFRFLGVDDTFNPDVSLRYNVSAAPKNKALHTFLIKPHPIKSILKPFLPEELRKHIYISLQNRIFSLQNQNLDKPLPLSPEFRKQLIEVYREDILKLQDLIQQDLSKWLE
jgi:hypothetical protein